VRASSPSGYCLERTLTNAAGIAKLAAVFAISDQPVQVEIDDMVKHKTILGRSKEDVERRAEAWLVFEKGIKVLGKTSPRELAALPIRRLASKMRPWEIVIDYG
jgi:glyceraldehyde-3-phosphate dehydrogenase/erythrose-4-phosphate dehydrogenase